MHEMRWTTISYLDGDGHLYSVNVPGIRSAGETERLQEYFQNNPEGAQELLKTFKLTHPEIQPPIRVQASTQVHDSTYAQTPQKYTPTSLPTQAPVYGPANREYWDGKRYHVEVDNHLRLEEVLFIRDNGWDPLLNSPEITSVLWPMQIPAYITKGAISVIPLATLKKRRDREEKQHARDAASISDVPSRGKVERPNSPTSLSNQPTPTFMYKQDKQAKSVNPHGAVGDGRPKPIGISMAALRRVNSALSSGPRKPVSWAPGLGHIELVPSSRKTPPPSSSHPASIPSSPEWEPRRTLSTQGPLPSAAPAWSNKKIRRLDTRSRSDNFASIAATN